MKKIIVVGAGPSGLHVAYRLCKNYEVHVFEKLNQDIFKVAHPWTDSIDLETLPVLELPIPVKKGIRFYGEGVKNREDRIGIYEPVKKSNASRIAVDRNALICALLEKVKDKVVLHYNCAVKHLLGKVDGTLEEHAVSGIVYEENGIQKEMSADLVIDASGAAFALRYEFTSCLGEKVNKNDIFSAYKTMRKLTSEEALLKYSNGELIHSPKGYRWISQLDDDILDVGCCIVSDIKDVTAAQKEAEAMISKMNGVEEESFGGGGNIIPMTLPIASLVCNGFASVGENAIMTNPGNGCGISGAVLGAEILSNIILNNDDFSISGLWEYAYEWFSGRGAYYASNFFPSQFFSEEEYKILKDKKLITGSLKNSAVTSLPEACFNMNNNILYDLKNENEELYKKTLKLKECSKEMFRILLNYPKVWNQETFKIWEKEFRSIKNMYY